MLLFFKTQATQLQHLTDTSYISQSNTKELLKNCWKKDFYLILKMQGGGQLVNSDQKDPWILLAREKAH